VSTAYSTPVTALEGRPLHLELHHLNESRLNPTFADKRTWRETLAKENERRLLEADFLEASRAEIVERARTAPTDAEGFLKWFENLEPTGPGQHDPLFDWLENEASMNEFRWFLTQEVAGEAGFDDLVAMTQLKMPTQPKLELARNYWDEMGRGIEVGMHGPMLSRLAANLELDMSIEIVWEAMALGNLLAGLAFNRRFAYHSIGALGAVELTAPDRSRLVNKGLRRLRVPANDRQYFALHSTLDVKHSIAWNAEVIGPLVNDSPELAHPIAEGALMRLMAGGRCFERYRKELGFVGKTPPPPKSSAPIGVHGAGTNGTNGTNGANGPS
jgi:hypothetical protein